jgi:mono/diheme cytochrome c family protein
MSAERAVVLAAACLLAGCEQGMKDMYDQDKYQPLDASQLWKDGRSARPLVPGTVPYSAGVVAETSSGARGEVRAEAIGDPGGARGEVRDGSNAGRTMPSTDSDQDTVATLRRGQQRFGIFCAPCHGTAGDGDGYIVLRGFPRPPSYYIDRLRAAPDGYLYEVISNGHGVMYGYGDRIDEPDRHAIVGYIRALQRAQPPQREERPGPQAQAAARSPSTRGATP